MNCAQRLAILWPRCCMSSKHIARVDNPIRRYREQATSFTWSFQSSWENPGKMSPNPIVLRVMKQKYAPVKMRHSVSHIVNIMAPKIIYQTTKMRQIIIGTSVSSWLTLHSFSSIYLVSFWAIGFPFSSNSSSDRSGSELQVVKHSIQFLRQVTQNVRPYIVLKQAAMNLPIFARHRNVKGIPIKAYTMVIARPASVLGVMQP